MKLKKIFTAILIILVILGLGASYLFTGLTPQQQTVAPTADDGIEFVGPTGNPSVKGPTAPPPGGAQ